MLALICFFFWAILLWNDTWQIVYFTFCACDTCESCMSRVFLVRPPPSLSYSVFNSVSGKCVKCVRMYVEQDNAAHFSPTQMWFQETRYLYVFMYYTYMAWHTLQRMQCVVFESVIWCQGRALGVWFSRCVMMRVCGTCRTRYMFVPLAFIDTTLGYSRESVGSDYLEMKAVSAGRPHDATLHPGW